MGETKPYTGSISRSGEPPTRGATRQGAGVFEVSQFVPAQSEAWEQAIAIITSTHAGLRDRRADREAPAERFFKRYERARPSQVILFDAGRGAGKSSLLFSLCEHARTAWLDRWTRRQLADERARATNGEPSHVQAGVLEWCFPLRVLDMHPLPAARPLIAYLFTLFDELRRQLLDSSEADHAPPLWMNNTSKDSARQRLDRAWRTLAQAANSYGHQGARSAEDDAVSAGLELIDEARAAWTLNEHFYRFAEELCSMLGAQFGLHQPALLLVPIDDADMNLQRSVECIELLRSLYHPQVIFVLTGHSDLFITQLRERTLEQLRFLDSPDAHHYARKYAFELYDRVIPPSHRCEIKPMDFSSRLIARLDVDRAQQSISELLSGREMPASQLAGIVPHLLTEDWSQQPPRRVGKRLAAALPDRLRGLLNLLLALRALPRDTSPERARINEALTIWEHATNSMLSQEERAALEDVTRWLYPESGERVELPLSRFRWRVVHRQIASLGERTQPRVRFFSSRVDGADLALDGERFLPLDARQTSALALLVNVVEEAFANAVVFEDSPFFRNMLPGWFARAEVDTAQGTRVVIPWPIPAWQRLSPASRFNTRWEQLARAGILSDDESAVRWFVALIILSSLPREMARNGPWRDLARWPQLAPLEAWERRFQQRSNSKVDPITVAPTNKELAEAVLWCMSNQQDHIEHSSDVVALYDWLRLRMPLILAPEGGLPDSIVTPIFEEIHKQLPAFDDYGPDLVRARKERLQHMQLSPSQFERASDPWSAWVRDVPPFNAERVFEQLKNVTFSRVLEYATSDKLGAYFAPEASPALLSDLPNAIQLAVQRFIVDAPTMNDAKRCLQLQDIAASAAREFGAVDAPDNTRTITLSTLDARSIPVRRFFSQPLTLEAGHDEAIVREFRWRLGYVGAGRDALEFLVALATDSAADFLNRDLRVSPPKTRIRKWPGWIARWNVGDVPVTTCALPMPDFPAKLDDRLLGVAWREELNRRSSPALALLVAVARVARREVSLSEHPDKKPRRAALSIDGWSDGIDHFFSREFEKLLSSNTERAKALAAFRSSIPLFAAPERRLSGSDAHAILYTCQQNGLRWTPEQAQVRRSLAFESAAVTEAHLTATDDAGTDEWRAFVRHKRIPKPNEQPRPNRVAGSTARKPTRKRPKK